jgi:hypothetical protein
MFRAVVLIVVALAILLLIVVNHVSHTTQEHQATGPEVSALTTQPKPAVEERKLPTEETLFISTVSSYRRRYGEALNEFQKSAVRKERATALARVLPGRSAEDWIGEISSMTTTSDGDGSLSVRLPGSNPPITVKTWNNGLSDIGSGTLIPSGSPLYEQVAHLAIGNKVTFGGAFSSGNLDYMREASLTEAGSMNEPEFIFTFTSVRLETATPTQPSSLATTANNAAPPADTATPIDNAQAPPVSTPAAVAPLSPSTNEASPRSPSDGNVKRDQRDGPPFALVGTVTNTTNPSRPITAPVRMAFGPARTCVLTISPPLIGSGACTLTQYDETSGHIEITSKGVVNISWSGSLNGATAGGRYRVGATAETGSFRLTIEHPGSSLAAIGRALTMATKGPTQ